MKPSRGELVYSYARSGDVRKLEELTDVDVNWRHAGNHRQTPVYTAAKYGRVGAVKWLLSRGADPTLTEEGSSWNALHVASSEGHMLVVQDIVGKTPTLVNVRTEVGGFTPLYLACLEGRCAVARQLLMMGADPNLADENGCTPLMAATLGNHDQIMSPLLDKDANLEATNRLGWSALHFAAYNGKLESLRWLLINGASGSRENQEKKTALDIAQDNRQMLAVSILLNPPRLTGLPRWRPAVHHAYPAAFRQNCRGLLLAMVRLRKGPLREMHREIVKMMIFQLSLLYIAEDDSKQN